MLGGYPGRKLTQTARIVEVNVTLGARSSRVHRSWVGICVAHLPEYCARVSVGRGGDSHERVTGPAFLPLVGVHLGFLADEVGETATHPLDGSQRVLHLRSHARSRGQQCNE